MAALFAVTAVVAVTALFAVTALVAVSAVVAWVASVALGTVPSVERSTFDPVTAPFFSLDPVTAPFLILPADTAFFFSWLLPTLFLLMVVAATAVAPPRTRKTAIDDITFAYVSRLAKCFKVSLLTLGNGSGLPMTGKPVARSTIDRFSKKVDRQTP